MDRPPVSVILPTREWGSSCDQLAEQIRDEDELLVVCDFEDDPLYGTQAPENVRIMAAGAPVGCSGKANAVAYGMEQARNHRFVWTDDDFDRGPNWLEDLARTGEEHGPATVLPVFVGGGWWRIIEPWVILTSTASFYFGVGPWGGNAWGGGVTFTREDVSVQSLISDLRQSLSDDGILSDHLETVHPIRSKLARVHIPGNLTAVKERMIRFIRLSHVHEGGFSALGGLMALVLLAVVFPVWTAITLTASMGLVYGVLGLDRKTFLLTVPGLLLAIPTAVSGIVTREFEWGDRRYRLNGKRDVEVVSSR
ncbi:MAG: glycosyltransferase family 2 protein [Halodesulfurarchaeum sp.]